MYGSFIWKQAARFLDAYGFSDKDADAVLKGAHANRFNPLTFASGAVKLRQHIGKGLPL